MPPPDPTPVLSPAGEPKPNTSPMERAVSTTIVTAISTIASWMVSLAVAKLPVAPPQSVLDAISYLTLAGVAFAVSFMAAKMRNSQWMQEGAVTGAKTLL